MMQRFDELVLGDVLIAPFVTYAGAALLILLVLHFVFLGFGWHARFSFPPAAILCLYVVILAFLVLVV